MQPILIFAAASLGFINTALAQVNEASRFKLITANACITEQNKKSYATENIQASNAGSCEITQGEAYSAQIASAGSVRTLKLVRHAESRPVESEAIFWFSDEPQIVRYRNTSLTSLQKIQFSDMPKWGLNLLKANTSIFSPLPQPLAEQMQQERQRAEEERQEKTAAETAKLRADIAKMNAGQLFAKADELSSSGDSAKAREVLRSLVSRFPDHPLAAQAAAQMAGMNGGQSNTAANNGANVRPSNSSVSNVSVPSVGSGNCWEVLGKREKDYEAINRRAAPAGATPPLMRVMWMTADSIKIIDTYCAGDAKAAKYRGELQTAYNQAKTACEQLTAGGQCQPNSY